MGIGDSYSFAVLWVLDGLILKKLENSSKCIILGWAGVARSFYDIHLLKIFININ
jgi:hypothetical protein